MGDGPPGFPQGSSCPAVLGCRPSSPMPFAYGALTLCGAAFQRPRLDNGLVTRLPPAGGNGRSRNTHRATAAAYHARRVWALPRSLAATYGIVVTFFSSGYLDVSVHRLPSGRPIYSAAGGGAFTPPGFPIRKSPDQSSIAAPRGVSPLTASFIGPLPQGIHRAPFTAWKPFHDTHGHGRSKNIPKDARSATSGYKGLQHANPNPPKEDGIANRDDARRQRRNHPKTLCGCQDASPRKIPKANGG